MDTADFLIIGGGIIGLSTARELKRRHTDARVVVLEKEQRCGMHASGRNSGVLHAGFYYTADSLKARYTQLGNQQLNAYCDAKGIPVNRCGKLVVARDERDLPQLDELLKRGRANGVPLEDITEAQAKAIEPRVKTHGRALFSPTTASVDPARVVAAMLNDARAEGIAVHTGSAFLAKGPAGVRTTAGDIQAGYVINAAGLYADRIAMAFGFSHCYRILPFKGLYMYSDEPPNAVKTNIYPVPDLRNPFLGVHFTVTADGHCKIGPTAIPALWREQYQGMSRFRLDEFAEISGRQARLLLTADGGFRRLAVTEVQKYSRDKMVAEAGALLDGVDKRHYRRWAKPGIRAQLLNIETNKLVMDFVMEGDDKSMHILNAVSPAFTCALPVAGHVCDEVDRQLR